MEKAAKKDKDKKKTIPRDLYWEWRTTAEELQHEKTKVQLAEERTKVAFLHEENIKLKVELAKHFLRDSRAKCALIEKDYQKFVGDMESKLGFSIQGKLIDPYTFEVYDEAQK